jgi:hypothetical protein
MGVHGRMKRLLFTALLVAAGAVPIEAQLFQGRVLEEGEGVPVAEAWVELLGSGGISLGRTLTDDQGAFRLETPGPGTYRLRASRAGYNFAVTDSVAVEAGQTERVFISLALRPFVLDSLVVAGARRPGARAPGQEKFSHRASLDLGGVFLTRVHMLDRDPAAVSDMVRTVEGFMLTGTGELRANRGQGCLRVLLNDFPIQGMSLDEIPPSAVMGIEVYREAREVPEDLRLLVAPCGAVNVWMRGSW